MLKGSWFVKVFKKIILVWLVCSVLIIGVAYWIVSSIMAGLPNVAQLDKYIPPLTSEVYTIDRQRIGEFFTERRYYRKYEEIPRKVIEAFIASEDQSFFSHHGVDYWGILRALIVDICNMRLRQGGSTITQQLARSYFLNNKKTIRRKLKEIILSYQIEKNIGKRKIIELYLNMVFLGNGSYGVAAAAYTYFGKSLKELNLAEIALIAGLPQAPSKYNPVKNLSAAIRRQYYVLRRMRKLGYIDADEHDYLTGVPIILAKKKTLNFKYAPFFMDYVRQKLNKLFDEKVIKQGGLKVITTLDLELQLKANEVVSNKINKLREKYIKGRYARRDDFDVMKIEGALLSIEPKTGYIKVMVGGSNYNESQFNRVVQALRQPGSAFKPLYYALAVKKGYHPASIFSGEPVEIDDWMPKNFSSSNFDYTTLYYSLIKSLNIPSVKILEAVGIRSAMRFIKTLGIDTPLKREMGLSLGSSAVTMMELTKAFSVFPNQGYVREPLGIYEIYDKNNKLIYSIEDQRDEIPKLVLDNRIAYIMTIMLEHVIRRGTGYRARSLGRHLAGKTGTTNEGRDTWFIGFSQDLLTSVWVGHDNFASLGPRAVGSKFALPIWKDYMEMALLKYKPQPFVMPAGVVYHMIDPQTGIFSGGDGVNLPFLRHIDIDVYNSAYFREKSKITAKKNYMYERRSF